MWGGVGYDLLSLSTGVETMSAQNQMFVTITSASQLKSKSFFKKKQSTPSKSTTSESIPSLKPQYNLNMVQTQMQKFD